MDKYLKRKHTAVKLHETDESSDDELINSEECTLEVKPKKLHETDESSDDEPRNSEECSHKPKKQKLRKYETEYLNFGFVEYANNRDQPQCVICLQVLSNESMTLKPSKLKRHLVSRHSELQHKPSDYFARRAEEYTRQKKVISSATTVNEKALKASYAVAARIAKAKKAHTIAEELIMPAAVEICEIMIGRESSQKLKSVPVSNNTVQRRISDMSEDISSQLLQRLRQTKYAIQLDETTDIAGEAQLLV